MENFGKYQLIRKLATGGMAEVFLAKSAGPMGFEKTLVLKRILPHLAEDPRFVQMFLAEARLAARLDHPNVVQIFDLGEHEGGYFLAMEYVDGLSLRLLCRKLEKSQVVLPPAFCARLICMACEGLAYAHDLRDPEANQWLGIIHRDISPDNLLLSRSGTLKVVDFGLAKAAAVSETHSQVSFGKYWYMAPEQLRRKGALDRRVDIYALGVVLYELLTGKKPFGTTNEVDVMQAILQEELVPATRRRPELPPEIDRILGRALAPRDQRYASCQELQADLEQLILQGGATMGSQQISRLLHELGLLPQGGAGAPIPSPALAPPPPPPPSSIEAAERGSPTLTSQPIESGDRPTILESNPAALAATLRDVPRFKLDPLEPLTVRARLPEPGVALGPPTEPVLKAVPMPPPAPPPRKEPGAPKRRVGWIIAAVGLGVLVTALAFDVAIGLGVLAAVRAIFHRVEPTPPPRAEAPSPKPAPQPAPEPKLADLRINTDPPADVRVNGLPLGRAPVDLKDYPPGTIRIELSDPQLGFRKETQVELAPGDNGVKVFYVLRLPVELRITPSAHVTVDGRDLGETGGVKLQLFEGLHRLHLVQRDLHKNLIQDITVVPGGRNVFEYNLLKR